jgi:UDP-GlcNAc:undecaprenyl-phosphate/decaprenyl-phosphate GlcNAc-1-phosphate transferase
VKGPVRSGPMISRPKRHRPARPGPVQAGPAYAGPARSGLGRPRLAALAGAAAGACAARGAYAVLRRCPPAGEKTWVRTNHRGELVTLLEGPALSLGAVTGEVVAVVLAARPGSAGPGAGRRGGLPLAVAGLGALGFGVLDDLRGSAKRRGLRGHLGALAHGEITTGTVKLAGLAVTGLGTALLDGGGPVDVAVNSGLVAGGANLLNLFDLRPGRAIKVAALSAGLIAAGGALTGATAENGIRPGAQGAGRLTGLAAIAAPAGAALALLPEDLGERAMLGDAGANALGAMLGAAAARSLPRRARIWLLGGIAALTVTSEKVSFTKVIEATPPLRWLDMLGRRPAPLPAAAGPASARTAPASNAASTVPDGTVPDGAVPVGAAPGGQALAGDAGSARPDGAQDRRRQPGRHRRAAATVSRTRSGTWISGLLKTRQRQEP